MRPHLSELSALLLDFTVVRPLASVALLLAHVLAALKAVIMERQYSSKVDRRLPFHQLLQCHFANSCHTLTLYLSFLSRYGLGSS